MIKALVVGGPATFVNNVVAAHLAKHGIEVVAHRDYESRKPISAVPSEAELVLCMHDMTNHPTHDSAKELAKAHGLPFVLISRKYSVMAEQLTKVGYPALNLPDLQESDEELTVKAEVAIPAKDWRLRLVGKQWEAVYAEGQHLHGGFSSSIEAADWTRRYGASWLEDQQKKSEAVPVQKIQPNVSATDSFVPIQDALNEVGVKIIPYMFKSSFPSVRTDRRKDGVYVDLVGLKAALKRSKEKLPSDAIKRVDTGKILGIDPDALAVPVRSKRIPSYKHAGAIWVSQADVVAYWKTRWKAQDVATPATPVSDSLEKPPAGWVSVPELKKKYGLENSLAYKIARDIPKMQFEGPWGAMGRSKLIYVAEFAFLAALTARKREAAFMTSPESVKPTPAPTPAPSPAVPPVVVESRDDDSRLKALVSGLHAALCIQNFTGTVRVDLLTGKLRGTKTVITEVEL